jgi:hypothetical protein
VRPGVPEWGRENLRTGGLLIRRAQVSAGEDPDLSRAPKAKDSPFPSNQFI